MRTDGYYYGAVEWEDWHAGVHMRELHYHFWRFYPNGNWVCCHRYEPNFAFWPFTDDLSVDDIEKATRDGTHLIEGGLQLFVAGTYIVEGDIVTTCFEHHVLVSSSGERKQVIRKQRQWRVVGETLVPLDGETGIEELHFSAPSAPVSCRSKHDLRVRPGIRRLVPRWKQQLGGLCIAILGAGWTAWSWHTALNEGYYYRRASVVFPMFCVMGLGIVIFPGCKQERVDRGENISGMKGWELITARWWAIVAMAIVAGFGNYFLLSSLK
jgi:hypothetical protein